MLPRKKVQGRVIGSRKYKQLASSIEEVGLIAPLFTIQVDLAKPEFLLLDDHPPALTLKSLGLDDAPCLMARDDKSYSYNQRVNRLSTIQEHAMIRRAIKRGVGIERLESTLNVNLNYINRRLNLLDGIVPQAIGLLQDQQFTPNVTRILRNMKPARQIEAVELMVASGSIRVTHAEAFFRATPPEQRSVVCQRANASEPQI